ncbi:jg11800 [Pararge aegeria aegeria]|uniref:Jg11800 protein n=1 Tax=Pararge aegeria aegeria TaxID=348720 RepID=A0A8S4S8Q8_9NEOP|nr:jg11800 [Pararge aegeria aegeria]
MGASRATVGPGRGLARDADGRRRRLHRETGPRVSGRGCGNRLRRNTRHENNRNSECTSEAQRDAVGASETRINTRLFTYGVRERGAGSGAGAIACNPRAAITSCLYSTILS